MYTAHTHTPVIQSALAVDFWADILDLPGNDVPCTGRCRRRPFRGPIPVFLALQNRDVAEGNNDNPPEDAVPARN